MPYQARSNPPGQPLDGCLVLCMREPSSLYRRMRDLKGALLFGESHHERLESFLQLDPPPYSCDCLDLPPGFLLHLASLRSVRARMRSRHGVSWHMRWRSVFIGHRCCGDRIQSTERRHRDFGVQYILFVQLGEQTTHSASLS